MVMMIWYWKYMGMSRGGPTAERTDDLSEVKEPAGHHQQGSRCLGTVRCLGAQMKAAGSRRVCTS